MLRLPFILKAGPIAAAIALGSLWIGAGSASALSWGGSCTAVKNDGLADTMVDVSLTVLGYRNANGSITLTSVSYSFTNARSVPIGGPIGPTPLQISGSSNVNVFGGSSARYSPDSLGN